ncbi:MAG: hypothetical protein KGS46_15930 [Chloroflexi bacterium]|nr:hypothetical protein [Chloroflexota bacterium]
MTTFEIDTRTYNRAGFVSELITSTCGSDTSALTTDQVIEYIDQNSVIIDFDDEVMPASRWRKDIVDHMFDAKFQATERLCKTDTEGTTNIADWMREGEWETMTPAQMAKEWDELNNE